MIGEKFLLSRLFLWSKRMKSPFGIIQVCETHGIVKSTSIKIIQFFGFKQLSWCLISSFSMHTWIWGNFSTQPLALPVVNPHLFVSLRRLQTSFLWRWCSFATIAWYEDKRINTYTRDRLLPGVCYPQYPFGAGRHGAFAKSAPQWNWARKQYDFEARLFNCTVTPSAITLE